MTITVNNAWVKDVEGSGRVLSEALTDRLHGRAEEI